MLHVILFRPEIPPNTGNVIRLCANTGAALHLIRPLGFTLDDARLRRAGLDYHEYTRLCVHDDLASCFAAIGAPRVFAFTTRAQVAHVDAQFADGDALLFGCETAGLPSEVLQAIPAAQRLRLPMCADSRSLNLSNTVAIAVYEAWRQLGFVGAHPVREPSASMS
jgi:tRNA (cytidine/uridine-2'-O-)-methyltransferase